MKDVNIQTVMQDAEDQLKLSERQKQALAGVQSRMERLVYTKRSHLTSREIQTAIEQNLRSLTKDVSVSVSSQWQRMNFRDRMKWWLMFRVFKWAGKQIRKIMMERDTLKWRIADLTGEEPELEPQPYWTSPDPKGIMLVNTTLTPIQPLEKIIVNATISPSSSLEDAPEVGK